MAAGATTEWGTWGIALAAGAVAALATLALFRFQPPAASAGVRIPEGPALVMRPAVPGMADFRDPSITFLPNAWSARPAGLSIDIVQRPGDTLLRPYDRRLSLPETAAVALPPPFRTPETPLDAVRLSPEPDTYLGFARSDPSLPTPAPREALIQAFAITDRRLVRAWPVPIPVAGGVTGDWRPLEFTVTVGDAGLLGAPVLYSGSGVAAVDAHFRNYLEKGLRIGAQVDPGTYRIRIEP